MAGEKIEDRSQKTGVRRQKSGDVGAQRVAPEDVGARRAVLRRLNFDGLRFQSRPTSRKALKKPVSQTNFGL